MNKLLLYLPDIIKNVYLYQNTYLITILKTYMQELNIRIEKSSVENKKRLFQMEKFLFNQIYKNLVNLYTYVLKFTTGKNIVNTNEYNKENNIIKQLLERDIVSDVMIDTFVKDMNHMLQLIQNDVKIYFEKIEQFAEKININSLFKGSKNSEKIEKYYDFMLQYSVQIKNARNTAKLITTNA